MGTTGLDVKYDKLPKYAQDELLRLRRIVTDLQEALRRQQQSTPSNIQWGRGFEKNRATGYLDDDETIAFRMCQHPDSHIRVCRDKDGLRISGDGRLSIICESSNCFTVVERL